MKISIIKKKLFELKDLEIDEALFLFEEIMEGKLNEIDLSAILISLKIKGETKEEIFGAVKIMRSKSLQLAYCENTVDTCGTGGDMLDTLNISTAASLVAASCGVKIAKHGNKSVSSKSGSADMLEHIGYKITDQIEELETQLNENNFCFMFAQYHHTAMKYVINVRRSLGTRTIFNLLGPLLNPANAKNQLLGVYDKKWLNTHCETLKDLGSQNVLVVHGCDGLDEITLTDNTFICELKNNSINRYYKDTVGYPIELHNYPFDKNWNVINMKSNDVATTINVPVGNMSHQKYVGAITLFMAMSGAFYVFYNIIVVVYINTNFNTV